MNWYKTLFVRAMLAFISTTGADGLSDNAKAQTITTTGAIDQQQSKAVWLIIRFGSPNGSSLTAIPTASMSQCEMAGAEYTASKRLYPGGDYRGFECLEGIR